MPSGVSAVRTRLAHGEEVARNATNRWIARGAVTAVLSVTGCAFLLAALALFNAAPLAGVALMAGASWLASSHLVPEGER